jgi:spore coat polysaccharide biosynthesis predicted glycosyltransferase SpsG
VIDGGVSRRSTTSSRRLVGGRYCLLDIGRPKPSREPRRSEARVLIALGGGVHVRRLARRLEFAIAERCPSAEIRVASGFVTSAPPALRRGTWIASPKGLASQLKLSNVAVVAGGQTLYEACALGIPAVSVAVVRAQRRAIEASALAGAVIDAGGPHVDEAAAARVAQAVQHLLESRAMRRRVSTRGRRLIDGRGAQRVARRVLALVRARKGTTRV